MARPEIKRERNDPAQGRYTWACSRGHSGFESTQEKADIARSVHLAKCAQQPPPGKK
jgi:hypothetical protein